jgi:conjugative transfer signal peptidase TraF
MSKHRIRILSATVLSMTAIVSASVVHMPYYVLYNPSESAPRGWYGVMPVTRVRVDDLVVVQLPESVSQFAAERHYLPRTVPLLKPVAAVSGMSVCGANGVLSINGMSVARAHGRDGLGRMLAPWSGCRSLADGEIFLLSHHSDASFDSRYFGPVDHSAVRGRAIPLWTW